MLSGKYRQLSRGSSLFLLPSRRDASTRFSGVHIEHYGISDFRASASPRLLLSLDNWLLIHARRTHAARDVSIKMISRPDGACRSRRAQCFDEKHSRSLSHGSLLSGHKAGACARARRRHAIYFSAFSYFFFFVFLSMLSRRCFSGLFL